MKTVPNPIVVFLFALFAGCGVSQPIRPVGSGKTDLLVSFGGPVIPLDGLAIPAPYLNLGAVHGVGDNFSPYGNIHLTAALFKDIGLDAGVVTTLVAGQGPVPEVNLNGRIYFFWDVVRSDHKRIFPLITITGHYAVGAQSLLYFGADNLFQIHTSGYFLSPLAGYRFPLKGPTMAQLEVKWLAANKESRHGIFEGTTSIGGKGGTGIFFGVQYPLQ